MTEFTEIDRAAKRPVDIWTNYFYYWFSLRFVYLIRKTGITPNQVTLMSFALLLVAAVCFAHGTRAAILLGLAFHQASFVLDCADGQLARYKKLFTPFGAWLDQTTDRVKEFLIVFSLASGYARWHFDLDGVWKLALIALFAIYLLEYYEQQRGRLKTEAPADLPLALAGAPAGVSAGNALRRLRAARQYIPFRGFTIGEQYFLVGVLLLATDAKTALSVVAWVGLAMAVYHPFATLAKTYLHRGGRVV